MRGGRGGGGRRGGIVKSGEGGGFEESQDSEEWSGWGWWGGEIGICHEDEEGSKRRRRIGVRASPVEGEREEGKKTTLTLHELFIMIQLEQLVAHDRNDPTASLPSFLASMSHTLILPEVKK